MHLVATFILKGSYDVAKKNIITTLLLLSQVQEIALCKMRCTHSNIWVELFWNSVVNTT